MKKMNSKKKKLIMISVLSLLVVSSVLGAWIISLSGSITGSVTSDQDGVITWTTPLVDLGAIEVTNASAQETRSGVITNSNGDLNFTFTANETIVDEADLCDNAGDVTISYELNSVLITDSEVVELTTGANTFDIIYDIARSSCPQNVTVGVTFLEA